MLRKHRDKIKDNTKCIWQEKIFRQVINLALFGSIYINNLDNKILRVIIGNVTSPKTN